MMENTHKPSGRSLRPAAIKARWDLEASIALHAFQELCRAASGAGEVLSVEWRYSASLGLKLVRLGLPGQIGFLGDEVHVHRIPSRR